MLGNHLVTKQTGPAGRICNEVMVTTRLYSRKELYLSVMMERNFGVSFINCPGYLPRFRFSRRQRAVADLGNVR